MFYAAIKKLKGLFKINIVIIIVIILGVNLPVRAELYLTQEEKEYIERSNIIKAGSMEGVAPQQYIDEKGKVKGISIEVLEEISDMTGLVFEYKLYDTIEDTYKSDSDIIFGVSSTYAPDNMILSRPYLKSGTILYINSSLSSNMLEDKVFAGIKGGSLPEGVNKENVIYYNTREESMNAVEKGRADYGYGNAYSVAFYILQNGYKNIVTIPNEKEPREYCIGSIKDNKILISIINKSIEEIDDNKMQSIILDATSKIDRKISLSMIINAYGSQLLSAIAIVMAILIYNITSNIRAKNRLELQNKRHEILSSISNEYLYEYYVGTKELEPSEKFFQLFGTGDKLNEAINILKDTLVNKNLEETTATIKIPLANGEIGVFKSMNSSLSDAKGRVYSIIGKLIDISEEIAEKERLIIKAQIDGLTDLYNNVTTKQLVNESISNRDEGIENAFIIIDCDKFKNINDTLGHLVGDKVLKKVSKSLKNTFRETDIIGRIGGDEFAIYMKNAPSVDFVRSKCEQLNYNIQEINKDFQISVSIGVAFLKDEKDYKELFRKADESLYKAKQKGGGQVVIYYE